MQIVIHKCKSFCVENQDAAELLRQAEAAWRAGDDDKAQRLKALAVKFETGRVS
jgi:hypothetical protein